MKISPVKGYAIVTEVGAILTNTVSPTIRGAQVNWLVASEGLMISMNHTDGMIQHLFDQQSRIKKVGLYSVIITADET